MKRKWMSGLVAGLLAAVLVTGCNGGESGSKAPGESGAPNTSSSNSAEGVKLPELNITGDTVRYLCWGDKKELSEPTTWAYRINELMKEKYGCSLDYVRTTYEELPSKAAQMVLSGDSPDLIFFKQQDNPNFILNEIVQPVDDYINFEDPFWKDLKPLMDEYAYNGKHYLPVLDVINNGYIYYYKGMFEDAGLQTPLELYRAGDWTWSKFRELAKELTVDKGNDGTIDVYGCTVSALYYYMSCGEDFVKFADDGTITNNMKSPTIAKAMNLLFDMGSTKDGSRNQQANDLELFQNGQVAMMWNEAWVTSALGPKFKDGSVEFAPSPKMDGAEKYFAPGRVSCVWLAKGAANPGGAIAFSVVQRYSDIDPATKSAFRKAEQEQTGFTDEVYALMDEMNSDKFTILPSQMEGVGNWGNDEMFSMFNQLAQWDQPWSTVVETYYPVLQAQIDAMNAKLK